MRIDVSSFLLNDDGLLLFILTEVHAEDIGVDFRFLIRYSLAILLLLILLGFIRLIYLFSIWRTLVAIASSSTLSCILLEHFHISFLRYLQSTTICIFFDI